jgi:transcriptional regulator with XRE-family HTH domain
MTNYDETAGTESPLSLLDALRRSIEQEETTEELPDMPTESEVWGDEYLGTLAAISPAVVVAAADLMIESHEPRPEARARMLDAASRALAERRDMNGLLPVLLRNVRERNVMSWADVAARANLSETEVEELESGDMEINLHLPVDITVAWIRALQVEGPTALAALRRSLEVGWTGELALAAGDAGRPVNIEQYMDEAQTKLASVDEEGSS